MRSLFIIPTSCILVLGISVPAVAQASDTANVTQSTLIVQRQTLRPSLRSRAAARAKRRRSLHNRRTLNHSLRSGSGLRRRIARKRPNTARLSTAIRSRRNRNRLRRSPRVSTRETQANAKNTEGMKWEVAALTNAERNKEGLPPLRYNALLETAAQKHAQDMFRRGYFGHDTPEGLDFQDRIKQAGYGNLSLDTCNCHSYSLAFGENNAKGQDTPTQAIRDWMNSPGHRSNILSPNFEEVGIGHFGNIWVQNFGRMLIER